MRDIFDMVHVLNEMNRIIKQIEDMDIRIADIEWTLDNIKERCSKA